MTSVESDKSISLLPRLSLRANFSWTFVGNIVYSASQWGMLIALANFGTPEIVGQFSLALAITAPVIMFTNLQLRVVQATDARREYDFADYFGLRLLMTPLAWIIILAIALVSGYRTETILVIAIVGLAKAFESISDVFYGLLQQRERMDRMAISMMLKGPLSLVTLIIGLILTQSIIGAVIGLALAWAIVLIIIDVPSASLVLKTANTKIDNQEQLRPRWIPKLQRTLFWNTLPMGIVMMLISLNTSIPRYFIEYYLGEEALGIFSSIAYLMVAGITIVAALGTSASPKLSQYIANGNLDRFRDLLIKLLGVALFLGVSGFLVAWFGGKLILGFIYPEEYAAYSDVLIWIMVAAGIGYMSSFLGYAMTAARYFRTQLVIFIIVALATGILSAYLIPQMGLIGGAIALILSAIIQFLCSVVVIIRIYFLLRHQISLTERVE